MRRPLSGLYAVTPDSRATPALVAEVEAALAGGARAIQYRNKRADPALAREQAAALLALTRAAGAMLIVNDSVELARAIGADGVHLGATDGDLRAARAALGAHATIGASCYDQLALAHDAVAAGADYVAFGSAFASSVKPAAVRAPLALFTQARAALTVPICAIGGITAANAAQVIAAGAHAVAVISAVFDATDVRAAAADIARLFREAV